MGSDMVGVSYLIENNTSVEIINNAVQVDFLLRLRNLSGFSGQS
jgi:hypothetical protein